VTTTPDPVADEHGAEHIPASAPPNERVREVRIDGVRLNSQAPIGDDRGVIVEYIDEREDYWAQGVPYVYAGTCRPGRAKGWGMHQEHDDRYLVLVGEMLLVLWDGREGSPTAGTVQEFYLTRDGLNQILIPRGVWHAHLNPGTVDLVFVNAPTMAYRHGNPDKVRLPLENDVIPYSFAKARGIGW